MKIFVEHNGRVKKLSFTEWEEVRELIAARFGVTEFLLEYSTSDSLGKSIWVEIEDADDVSDGCSIRVVSTT